MPEIDPAEIVTDMTAKEVTPKGIKLVRNEILGIYNFMHLFVTYFYIYGCLFPLLFPQNYITKRRQIKRLFLTVIYFKIMVC